MSSQNIPPPPQYPNYTNVDNNDSNVSKENSVMENSVIYISDNGSPNYKTARNNGYQHGTNQILPNLVNSINSAYQNLPPKSPKSNYRNMLNNVDLAQRNNQWRQAEPHNEPISQPYRPAQNMAFSKPNQQYWMVRPREDVDDDHGYRERNDNMAAASAKTRSHPNLMNEYVNLAGTETILNDILYNRSNRPFIPVSNDSNKNYVFKPQQQQQQHQINHEQFNGVIGPAPTSPEFVRNGLQLYSTQGLAEYAANPENFATESSRLVNLLLEENKRLRSKLRQSDSRLESVDQLERKIHNLEILFEELLTSQRRQRLLDLQLQQASLTNYIVKNVSQNDVMTSGACTTSSDNNRHVDLRKTAVTTSQSIIPSSPIINQKLTEDCQGERSNACQSKQQKNEGAKRAPEDQERYLMEPECSEAGGAWPEQTQPSPGLDQEAGAAQTHLQRAAAAGEDGDLCLRLRQTIKAAAAAGSPYLCRGTEACPSDLLGARKVIGTPARGWLVHQSSTPPAYRLRLSQQPALLGLGGHRVSAASPKATSVLNLTSS